MSQPDASGVAGGFPRLAKAIHWLTAVGVIGLILLGWYMTDLPLSPLKFQLYMWHKEIGVLIFGLTVARLVYWRFATKPAPLTSHAPWEKRLSKLVHGLLYAALLGLPIAGWIASSAAGFSVSLFGVVTLPDLVAADPALKDQMTVVHWLLGWMLIASLGLHIAGALKHHVIDKDVTLRRMLPFGLRPTPTTNPVFESKET
ncbi:MAG: cytochrome b [Rhodospirillaceae bacterium]